MGEWIKGIFGYILGYALRFVIGLVVLAAFLYGLNYFGWL